MTFSIIVPVYNVENYLRKCLDSLVNQTFHDYEIIIVDDGSKDSSGKICEEYAEKYNIVKVIHKKNEGQGAAWMREGLNAVQGDYIGSIDSDDWVDLDLLERISKEIDNTQPDILVYGYKNVNCNGEQNNTINARNGYYDKDDIVKEILPRLINTGGFSNRNCIYLSRVNKFIKKEVILSNMKYYDTRISFGEDNIWTIPNVLSAKSIYVFSDWYPYYYRINPSSTTHSYHERLWDRFCELSQLEINILKSYNTEWMSNQIYCDMVLLAAISINNVMRSGIRGKKAIDEIRKIVKNSWLQQGLRGIKPELCSKPELIIVLLMKAKASLLIYIAKRIQYSFRR